MSSDERVRTKLTDEEAAAFSTWTQGFWTTIASIAWIYYKRQGRGAVSIDGSFLPRWARLVAMGALDPLLKFRVDFGYLTAETLSEPGRAEWLLKAIADYDPESEVVMAIRLPTDEPESFDLVVDVLRGREPIPRDAAAHLEGPGKIVVNSSRPRAPSFSVRVAEPAGADEPGPVGDEYPC